ncbi:hypothetical protein H1R20_g13659, partial [Candolleomyces eurysporus]
MNGSPHKKDSRDEEKRKEREKDRELKEKVAAPLALTRLEPSSSTPANAPSSGAPSNAQRPWPPEWLTSAMQAMQKKYPNDKFDVILRKTASSTPEWRIKCLDCPGKLYTPGPNETLTNYEVHLKNRQHRQRVNQRLGIAPPSTGNSTPGSGPGSSSTKTPSSKAPPS